MMRSILLLSLALSATLVTQAQDDHVPAKGYAVFSADGKFAPYEFKRHAVGDNDVLIEILYAGVCHSDHFHDNELTQGGYSNKIVVSERFAIKVPQNAAMEKVSPLMCAGITTYSPLKYTNIKREIKWQSQVLAV